MKVAVVDGPGVLRLDDWQRPVAGPSDVVMKVIAAGICGSDIAYRTTGAPQLHGPGPVALGHEFAGEIVEVGPDVKSFRIGDRVAYNSYNSPADFGRGGEGAFCAYVALRNVDSHTQSLCPVPENVSLEHAALVEPLSVAMHAVNRAAPQPGESAAVFGVGPIGLGIVIALRWLGCEDIIAFDPSPMRRELAMQLGARAAFDPKARPPAEVLAELRGEANLWGRKLPITEMYFEASGAPGLLSNLTAICNKGARIVTVAIQKGQVALDGSVLMGKELTVMGSQGYPTEFPEVMRRLAEGSADLETMISHRFPFSDFMNAFETAADTTVAAKVLLTFD